MVIFLAHVCKSKQEFNPISSTEVREIVWNFLTFDEQNQRMFNYLELRLYFDTEM